jgi:C-terminal processing protease CtpA/Prc
MAWTKKKTAAVVGLGILLAAITVTVVIKSIQGRTSSTGGKSAMIGQPSTDGPIREFVGVGLMLASDGKTGAPVVRQIVPHSPAAEAGITPGLIVSKIDNRSLEGTTLRECVDLIRGEAGTKVRLELINPDAHETNTVELTRQKINLRPGPRSTNP